MTESLNFEAGFLKEAEQAGCDVSFLRGLLKEADEMVASWKAAFDELADQSGDPNYRTKLAHELIYFNQRYPEVIKQAGLEDFMGSVNNGFNQAGSWITNFIKQHPEFLSQLLKGGVGGGLGGLALGGLMGHPGMGMMMGGLAGAAAYPAYNMGYLNSLFNEPAGAADKTEQTPAIKPATPATSGVAGGLSVPATLMQPPPTPKPMMAVQPPVQTPGMPKHSELKELSLSDILKEANQSGFGASGNGGSAAASTFSNSSPGQSYPTAPTAPPVQPAMQAPMLGATGFNQQVFNQLVNPGRKPMASAFA